MSLAQVEEGVKMKTADRIVHILRFVILAFSLCFLIGTYIFSAYDAREEDNVSFYQTGADPDMVHYYSLSDYLVDSIIKENPSIIGVEREDNTEISTSEARYECTIHGPHWWMINRHRVKTY